MGLRTARTVFEIVYLYFCICICICNIWACVLIQFMSWYWERYNARKAGEVQYLKYCICIFLFVLLFVIFELKDTKHGMQEMSNIWYIVLYFFCLYLYFLSLRINTVYVMVLGGIQSMGGRRSPIFDTFICIFVFVFVIFELALHVVVLVEVQSMKGGTTSPIFEIVYS